MSRNLARKSGSSSSELSFSCFPQLQRVSFSTNRFERKIHCLKTEGRSQRKVGGQAGHHSHCHLSSHCPSYHRKVSLATFSDAPEKLGPLTASARRRIFQQIIVKCVLQLLLIETTHELLQNDDVYNTIPAKHLLRFMTALDDSYEFARKFNADKDLRLALWKVGECFRPLTSAP